MPNKKSKRRPSRKPVVWVVERWIGGEWRPAPADHGPLVPLANFSKRGATRERCAKVLLWERHGLKFRVRAYERRG